MMHRLKPQWLIAPTLFGAIAWFLLRDVALAAAVFGVSLLPAIIAVYVPYAKDNPKGVWFKRKLYGWGWTPVTWQGWLVTALYIALLAAFGLTIDQDSPPREIAFTFVLPAALLTATFLRIAYAYGEKPKWQWGAKS